MKIIQIIIYTLLSLRLCAQKPDDSTGIKLFNKGLEYYNEGKLDSTLIIWTKIVEEKIGIRYDVYGNAFFNIPTVYWQLKKYDKSKEWYKRILASDLRDSDETGSLMEPHTNYKHKSAMALAGLYEMDSNYVEVLNWLYKADTVYRYWGFEGSATNVSLTQANLLEWKIAVLQRLNKSNDAIRAIIIELICSDRLEHFLSVSENNLLKLIDRTAFKSEFDKAIGKIQIHKLNDSNWTASFLFRGLQYDIPISNVYPDRNIPHYWRIYFIDKNEIPDKQKIVTYIKERGFYKKLNN